MKPQPTTLVTPEQIDRVLAIVDTFHVDRDAVLIPIKSAEAAGGAMPLPDGRILLHPPAGDAFEPWIQRLPAIMESLDLRNTRRARAHA